MRHPTTKLGRRSLWSLALSVTCFVGAITFEGVGERLYGTGDWPGVTGSALGLGWIVAVAGVFGFAVAGVVLAVVAIVRRGERAPGVFVAAIALPAAIVIGNGLVVLAAMILVAAAVLNEIVPRRSH